MPPLEEGAEDTGFRASCRAAGKPAWWSARSSRGQAFPVQNCPGEGGAHWRVFQRRRALLPGREGPPPCTLPSREWNSSPARPAVRPPCSSRPHPKAPNTIHTTSKEQHTDCKVVISDKSHSQAIYLRPSPLLVNTDFQTHCRPEASVLLLSHPSPLLKHCPHIAKVTEWRACNSASAT